MNLAANLGGDVTAVELLRAVGMALAHNVWQAGAIALVLAGALRALPGGRARARYGAACAAMAATTVAFLLTVGWLLQPGVAPARALPRDEGLPRLPAMFRDAAPRVADRVEASVKGGAAPPQVSEWLTPTVAATWLGCVCVMVGWNAVGLARVGLWSRAGKLEDGPATAMVARLSGKMGLARAPRVFLSGHVSVPAVVGHFRPAILLPLALVGELSTSHLEAILAHELAHVCRGDYLANLLQTVAETLFFHHPAVRWMGAVTRREREHCCDDLAAGAIGSAATYARALGQLEALRAEELPMTMIPASNTTKLLPRIRRVLGLPATPTKEELRRERLASVVVVAAMVVPLVTACVADHRSAPASAAAAVPPAPAGTSGAPARVADASSSSGNSFSSTPAAVVPAPRGRPAGSTSGTGSVTLRALSPHVTVTAGGEPVPRTAWSTTRMSAQCTIADDGGKASTWRWAEPFTLSTADGKSLKVFGATTRLSEEQRAELETSLAAAKDAEMKAKQAYERAMDGKARSNASAELAKAMAELERTKAQMKEDFRGMRLADVPGGGFGYMTRSFPQGGGQGGLYYISGAERTGAYAMPGGRVSLLQALNSAGLPKNAATVTIRHEGSDTTSTLEVADITGGAVEAYIKAGDVIMITLKPGSDKPEPAKGDGRKREDNLYYVGGDVPRAGAFAPSKASDVLRAIIAAGGDPLALADHHVRITTRSGGEGEKVTETTVQELVNGKRVPIKAGDVIMVLPANAPSLGTSLVAPAAPGVPPTSATPAVPGMPPATSAPAGSTAPATPAVPAKP